MPIIVNSVVAREAINQIINKEDITVILCNNGGGDEIDQLLTEFKHIENVRLWKRETNTFVNPIWNDFMEYFLTLEEWDHLIILNSDLTLQKDWSDVIRNRWYINPDEIIVAKVSDDKRLMYQDTNVAVTPCTKIYSGIPGIFITLSLKQAYMVYPIPKEILIWFGDTWIYDILILLGETVVVPENLWAFHHHSTSVQRVPKIYEMIEEDKIAWKNDVEPLKIEKIKRLKDGSKSV